jgi:voltage-gated sodium channel
MYINMYGCDEYGYDESSNPPCTEPQAYGWIAAGFFSSFVLLATMIILNLFIGVIMTGMEEAQSELRRGDGDADHPETVAEKCARLVEQVDALKDALTDLTAAAEEEERRSS